MQGLDMLHTIVRSRVRDGAGGVPTEARVAEGGLGDAAAAALKAWERGRGDAHADRHTAGSTHGDEWYSRAPRSR